MFCGNCGAKVDDSASFCPVCGKPLSGKAKFTRAADDMFGDVEGEFSSSIHEMEDTFSGRDDNTGGRREHLRDDRGLVSYILLTILTCRIYDYYFIYTIARDLNVACEGDGEKTPGLLTYILLSMVTCGFYSLWWDYKIANRIQRNGQQTYGLYIQESGTTILLWYLLGFLICGIGPYVAAYFIIKNSNQLFHAYNVKYNV